MPVDNQKQFIGGLASITGISIEMLEKYALGHDILQVLDHPAVIEASDGQREKIRQLKDFINLYSVYRKRELENVVRLDSSCKAKQYFISCLGYGREREKVLCAYMNASMEVLSCEKVSEGTVSYSFVPPGEVLKRALQLDAVGIVLAHNHPGGSLNPSKADIQMTKTFFNILKPLQMKVFDHIIVGDNRALSMNEEGILFREFAVVSEEQYNSIPLDTAAEDLWEEGR